LFEFADDISDVVLGFYVDDFRIHKYLAYYLPILIISMTSL
jgi:hypothetical protein